MRYSLLIIVVSVEGYNCGGNHQQNRWSNPRDSAPAGRDGYGRNYSGGYSHSRPGPYAKGVYSQVNMPHIFLG